ncbi:TetR/AcrR family transcriptional regulator [bacterium]|nr:TetR/AcrR family transcriptional regulator [bacterium]MBU1063982.1 TetR/AcrR family transcriptional regulator [bacterium]MBU1634729.1 TetR/AcrR family transcriptional regulator [bacterium]MBU1874435.1 TetR/AcrR family transcriptional regulator [bacterium]
MVKSFDENERDLIRRKLLEKGRQLFEIYGLKKTTVDEITQTVGVAKGSFYNFFQSKEELFFEIFEEEEHFREQMLADLMVSGLDAGEALRQVLKQSLELVANSKIFAKMYEPGVYEQLLRKLPPEKMSQHQENDLKAGIEFVRHFQDNSNLRKVKPEVMIAFFRAIFTVTFHKEEIGPDVYPAVINLLVEVVAKGLVE